MFRASKRPCWMGDYDVSITQKAYDIFRDEDLKKVYFPIYYDVPAKEIMKHIHVEKFSYGILIFDYKENKVYNINDVNLHKKGIL